MDTTPELIVAHDSQTTLKNRFVSVREDAVTFPGGKQGSYNVVTSGNGEGVAILPLYLGGDGHWNVALVGQHRYPLAEVMYEIPRGGSNGAPEEEAARELREETSLTNRPLIFLGNLAPDSGLLNTRVATYAVVTHGPADMVPEYGCTAEWMRWTDYVKQVRTGNITADSFTLSAMALWMCSDEAMQIMSERTYAAQVS